MNQILKDKINESDLVLVGIGEDFEAGMEILEESSIYRKFCEKLKKENQIEENWEWLYPFLLEEAIKEENVACMLKGAYKNLFELLQNKNYFIITMTMDSLLSNTFGTTEKIVAPFGNYQMLQCDAGCNEDLLDGASIQQKIIACIQDDQYKLCDICQPKCEKCDETLVFNNVNAKKYVEKGYISQWEKYMKWLQGTVNRKACILEFGVSLNYPNIIRWPFEKMGYLNQKASFIRVNASLPQLTEELAQKGISIKENAVSFLANTIV